MEAELKAALLAVAGAYAAGSGLKLSTIGARCVGDARFFERIEAGKGFQVGTYDRALRYLHDTWPADAVWPAGVAKPAVGKPGDVKGGEAAAAAHETATVPA